METARAFRRGPRSGATPAAASPVYFISDRPEAYELWGEVAPDEARRIAALIAARATEHFPGVEFRVDGAWHTHPPGLGQVTAYIEGNWQAWLAEAPPTH